MSAGLISMSWAMCCAIQRVRSTRKGGFGGAEGPYTPAEEQPTFIAGWSHFFIKQVYSMKCSVICCSFLMLPIVGNLAFSYCIVPITVFDWH